MVFPKKGKEPEMPWRDPFRHEIKLAILDRCHSINMKDLDGLRKALGILPEKDEITERADKEHVCYLIAQKPEEVRMLNIVADMLYPYEYWWD